MKHKKSLLTVGLLLLASLLFAQRTVTGVVTDSAGTRLQGVTVTASGTTTATATDAAGRFRLTVPDGVTALDFTLVGYQKQTAVIPTSGDVNMTLQTVTNTLSDVVVVGYGVQRRRDVTGTISSVKGEDFKNLPVSNAAQALQGRASGVDIIRNDATPGAVPTIRIRGTGTINSADPLVVIDGVPAGSLNDVNPNDIASIEILKDASSSAIYGTRAANGVVLVTTRKGNYGEQLKVTINAYTGTSKAIRYLDLLTAPDLAMLKKETFTNDGSPVPAIWNDPYYATQRTDWQRALLGTGKTHNADVAIRGGTSNSNYSFSGNYFDEQGLIVNSYFKRYSARINSEHRLLKIIKVGENFQYAVTSSNTTDTRSTQTGTLWSALRFNPALPLRNDDGTWGTSKADNELGDINNPVMTATDPDVDNSNNSILANAYVEVDIVKGLKARANFGYNKAVYGGSTFISAQPNQTRTISLASLGETHSENSSMLEEYFITYNNTFSKAHNLLFTGGYSAQTFNGRFFSASRVGYEDPSEPQRILNNGDPGRQYANGSRNVKSGLASYFARVNYAFQSKYLLTVTMRADGSSKFPKEKQWGYFPAFSAGWRISDEAFFKENMGFLNSLKLTGGWGVLGNQAVPDLQYLSIIGTNYNYNFGNSPAGGTAVNSLSNPNITWERAEMTNISLEFGLLRNHLTGTLTYFDKNTRDMLIPFPLVQTYGQAGIPNQNIGTLNNRGVEVDVAYQNRAGRVSYSISANASFIRNRVTYLYGDEKTYIGSVIYGRQLLETSRTYEGQPIASFYGFKTDGLYQTQSDIDKDANITNDPNKAAIQPGDVRFLDQNSDGKIDDADRVYLGNPNPKAVFGLNGTVGFKGFDLNVSFAGVTGNKLYNADRLAGLDATQVFNLYEEALQRWHGAGTSNTVPRLTRKNYNNNYRSSDLWIEDGSYLALKNIALGYTFSNLHIANTKLPDARIYVSCFNAFYITGYSGYTPELGYTDGNRQRGVDVAQYPSARTFTVGATLNF